MLITALVGSLLAANSFSYYGLIVLSQIGIGLCAASAAAINQIIDQKADANMQGVRRSDLEGRGLPRHDHLQPRRVRSKRRRGASGAESGQLQSQGRCL